MSQFFLVQAVEFEHIADKQEENVSFFSLKDLEVTVNASKV